ncbi:MAG: hypothetical protein WCJ09_07890 [Planctomycetota bacterium]
MAAETMRYFEPTKDPLLDLAFRRVDDSMLREIAEADYGMDSDAHLQGLLAIKAGQMYVPMKWKPKEVLELTRWTEPEDPSSESGSPATRDHWMRLLSCAILIRAAAEPENDGYFNGEGSTIIQLVDSAIKLGEETTVATLQFLRWRMEYRRLDEWNRPYFAVAVLLLSVLLNKCDPQITRDLIAAANFEVIAFSQLFDDCLLSQKWKDATRRILCESVAASEDVRRFGTLLLGRTNAGW